MNFPESYPDFHDPSGASPWPASRSGDTSLLPGLAEAPSEASTEGSFEKHWLRTLAHVLTEQVQELFSAESLLAETIPMTTMACADPLLRAVSEIHLEQTREHLRRLGMVHNMLGLAPDGRTCLMMEGLLLGLRETIEENRPGHTRDCAMAAAMRKIKYFEIESYCGARDFAQLLGLGPVTDVLQSTLDEESTLDAKFANLENMLLLMK